jgi:hypothetical protein
MVLGRIDLAEQVAGTAGAWENPQARLCVLGLAASRPPVNDAPACVGLAVVADAQLPPRRAALQVTAALNVLAGEPWNSVTVDFAPGANVSSTPAGLTSLLT